MKSFFVSGLLFLATIVSPAIAEPPSNASLEDLLRATNTQAQVEQTISQLHKTALAMMRQNLDQLKLPESQMGEITPRMESVLVKFNERAKEQLSWNQMKAQYLKLYRETFTQEEVNGMIAFYRSPAGKAAIVKMPQVMQQVMQITQGALVPLMAQLQMDIEGAVNAKKQLAMH